MTAGPRGARAERASFAMPAELRAALEAEPAARERFERMPPSHRRETAGYVAEAKKPETRARRAARVVADLRSGAISG